ncbi:MAG: L-lactate permease [Chloroflexi bacterium]|nr:L-lactate permease [Chloroflexota bacterium]
MAFWLALIPILLILYLMAGRGWGAAQAGALGYAATLAIAALAFGCGWELLAAAHLKALLLAVDVLLIVWAAFLVYRVVDEAGAIETIGAALARLTGDRGMQALAIGWVFASFLQGVGGFGVPAAVTAPILAGLGFSPLAAVVIASIGHGWGVTFGSLGSSFQALKAASGLPGEVLAPPAALYLGASCIAAGWMVAHAAGGWAALRRLFWTALGIGAAMGAAQYITAAAGFYNLAAVAGGAAGLAVIYPAARRLGGTDDPPASLDWRRLLAALAGYLLLAAVILAVELIPGLSRFLAQRAIQVDIPATRTALGFAVSQGAGRSLAPLRHTGALLAYSAALAYGWYWLRGSYRAGAPRRIVGSMLRSVAPASLGVLLMVSMAVMMEHAGMTDALARGLAQGVGALFPLAAPWIGALGAFITGSNTNSNVLFGKLQLHTAQLLGYSPAAILAGQTAGAALASVIAPTKVVVAASTLKLAGREGEAMRGMAGYIALLVALISLLTAAGALIAPPGG